ncbi:ThiF family adenylyltransferase [bacterium]|nr:ThiF family adenylyltransferase [bacterium]
MNTEDILHQRYSRQIIFPQIGKEGQDSLAKGKIIIIGIGALGSHVADILARAGVGHITLVDRDIVELQNLQRQTLYDENDVKNLALKAIAAQKKLKKVNSKIEIVPKTVDVNPTNIENLVEDHHLVIDCTDNFETRFLINDIAMKLKIPWIYGAVAGSEGMTMNIIPGKTPCIRCAIDSLPSPGSVNTCENIGIIPSIAAVVASIQANETIKILISSKAISEELVTMDLWSCRFVKIKILKDESCPCCSGKYQYLENKDSKEFFSICGSGSTQYKPKGYFTLDLKRLKIKLENFGIVNLAENILKFKSKDENLLIFEDGRMILFDLNDQGRIRSIYSKYIGL